MSDYVWIALRVAAIIGIALFMLSVADSLEKIAKALTRLADERLGEPRAD